MGNDMTGISKDGRVMHYAVGAIIEQEGKYLLIDRVKPPFGLACIAGHMEQGETPEEAVRREVYEESGGGLEILSSKLLLEQEVAWNTCSKGVRAHYWHVYTVQVSGTMLENPQEVKHADWYVQEQLKDLPLENVWRHWFKTLHLI